MNHLVSSILYTIVYIIGDILFSIFQPLLFALPLAIFVMFFVLYAHEHGWTAREYVTRGKRAFVQAFRSSKLFKAEFALALFVTLVLFRTLYSRDIWADPLSSVFGGWGLYDAEGNFTAEGAENLLLFIPFGVLCSYVLRHERGCEVTTRKQTLLRTIQVSAGLSLLIEVGQLLLHLGTFQIADLTYNTLGGFLGALLFLLASRTHND